MRRVLDFANLTAAMLFGAYLLALVIAALFGLERVYAVPTWLATSGLAVICFLAGAFLVGANIYILAVEWRAGGLRWNLRVTTDHGHNELSVAALESLLLRDLKAQGDVADPIVRLQPRGEGRPMLCRLELKLRRQDDIIKRMDDIKIHIREIFDRLIPGGITVEVQEEVRAIIEDAPKTRDSAVIGKEFNGPEYPDDGEGV